MLRYLPRLSATLLLLSNLLLNVLPVEAVSQLSPSQTPWHHSLARSGGGWWSARIPLSISNHTTKSILGDPLFLTVGNAKDQLPITDVNAESLRVCDAAGNEMLYQITTPRGQIIQAGPIPEGSELSIPVECEANATCRYYVYFNNPSAGQSPELLGSKSRFVNGDVEAGDKNGPFGWRQDFSDKKHRVEWTTEMSRSGKRSLKTAIDDGAEPSWIATRQDGLSVQPGARYEFRAWVKGQSVKGAAGWYLHIGTREKSQMRNLMLKAAEGTFDWTEVHIQFTVPEEANRLNLGTFLRGTGTAWFDDASLKLLETPKEPALTATVKPVQQLQLQSIGNHDWIAAEKLPGYDYRLVVEIANPGNNDQQNTLLQVNINALIARYGRLLNLDAVRILCDGKPVNFYRLPNAILLDDNLPKRSVKSYQLYFTSNPEAKPVPQTDYAALVASRFNLLKNGSFEEAITTNDERHIPANWNGGNVVKAPIMMEQADQAAPGLGQRCARLNAPHGQSASWRGWRQAVAIQPNTKESDEPASPRTYLISGYLLSRDLRKAEQVDSEAFDPQAEASLGYAHLHIHFLTANKKHCEGDWAQSVRNSRANRSGQWELLQGNLSVPNDAAFIETHLTMDCTGELLHDGIFLGKISLVKTTPHLERRHNNEKQGVMIWPINAIQKVFPDDFSPAKPTTAKITLARNEKEPLQLAVRSTEAVKDIQIIVTPPIGPGGAALRDIKVGVVGYVPVDYPTGYYHTKTDRWRVKYPDTAPICDGWPGLWPDPILPTDTLSLKPNETHPVWITFGADKSTRPGTYRGKVRLVSPDKKTLAEQPFEIHIWDFTLPDENHVKAIYDIRVGPSGSRIWGEKNLQGVYDKILPFLAERRLNADGILPKPKIDWKDGQVVADFTEFDKAATRYFDELGMTHAYTPWDFYLFGWAHRPKKMYGEAPYPGKYPYDGADWSKLRPEYKQRYQACLKAFWDHITEKGWNDRFVLYISDEPFYYKKNILAQMKALCDMIHEVNPDIPIYSSTWHYVPGWKDSLDVWGIGHHGLVLPDRIAKIQKHGSKVWFTTDGQMCLDTPYCAVERLLPHYCFKYGAEAYEFWGVSWLSYNPFEFGMHTYIHQTMGPEEWYWVRYPNGDGYLIYPGNLIGADEPVSTIRLEQAREGVEDYEYLHLLRQLLQKQAAATPNEAQAKAKQALKEASQLVTIPNAGGRYSSKILPNPDVVFEVKQKVAQAIEGLQKAEK